MNPKSTYSEPELVFLLQQRANEGFSYLYDHYSAALYGVICQIVTEREVANDVLQEVFVNIWKKIESYDASKGRLFTWMLNIARNAAIDKVRSRLYKNNQRNRPLADDEYSNADQRSVAPQVSDVGLQKLLSRLKEEHRRLIDLSYYKGFTHEEIAKALDIPLGTVKTRIRTALTQLRTMMQ